MRNVHPILWVGLALSLLILMGSVSAQQMQIIPVQPAPHIQECKSLTQSNLYFGIMRQAGISREDALQHFNVSRKVALYLEESKQIPPVPPERVENHLSGVNMMYDIPEEEFASLDLRGAWAEAYFNECVEKNAPPPVPRAPRPDSRRMIPGA